MTKDKVALFEAVFDNNLGIMQRLLDNGADSNDINDSGVGYHVLCAAAARGHLQAIELVLRYGAKIDAKDKWGTPLVVAAYYGQTKAVELLIRLGADIEAKDNWGCTALMYAAEHGKTEAVKLLLKLGANKEAQDNEGMTALDMAMAALRMAVDVDFVYEGYQDIITILEADNDKR